MMRKIIVVQTGDWGLRLVDKALTGLDLKGVSVAKMDMLHPDLIRNILDPKGLFIIGTIFGDGVPARTFVRELRDDYPELTCVAFSSIDMSGYPFHSCIVKRPKGDESIQALKKVFQKFLGVEVGVSA